MSFKSSKWCNSVEIYAQKAEKDTLARLASTCWHLQATFKSVSEYPINAHLDPAMASKSASLASLFKSLSSEFQV